MNYLEDERANRFLAELRGTFLQVSAPSAPDTYSLHNVSLAFDQWALKQPIRRLAGVHDHLIAGKLDPCWDELGLSPNA